MYPFLWFIVILHISTLALQGIGTADSGFEQKHCDKYKFLLQVNFGERSEKYLVKGEDPLYPDGFVGCSGAFNILCDIPEVSKPEIKLSSTLSRSELTVKPPDLSADSSWTCSEDKRFPDNIIKETAQHSSHSGTSFLYKHRKY